MHRRLAGGARVVAIATEGSAGMSDPTTQVVASTGRRFLPLMTAIAIAVVMFVFGSLRYEHFGSPATLSNILAGYAFVGIAAVGMTLAIISGGIDLSVGSMVAFTSILIATLVQKGLHPLAAAAIALAAGSALGGMMGAIIHVFRLPSFIVTLAGMFAIRALGFLVREQSLGIQHEFYSWTSRHATLTLGGGAAIPLRTMIFLAALLTGMLIARSTAFGRNVYAIGGSARNARLMGVNVGATTIGVFALSGFCSALGGFAFTLYRRAGDPAAVVGLELEVIAAVVIGGTLLSGGVGGLAGTLIGVIIVGLIRTIIDFEGSLNAAWTSIATGMLLLAFVGLQQLLATMMSRRARDRRM